MAYAEQCAFTWLTVLLLILSGGGLAKPVSEGDGESDTNVHVAEVNSLQADFIADKNSRSNPNEAVTKAFHWRASVDFDKKVIDAVVRYNVIKQRGVERIILDASPDLQVHSVRDGNGDPLKYERLPEDMYGAPLSISLADRNDSMTIVISYSTSPTAGGLQWLEPDQTLGKKERFMYSQNQLIYARTMIPCQDTPQVKMTFFAEVEVPEGLVALMGAVSVPPRQPRNETTATASANNTNAECDSFNNQTVLKPTRMFRFRQDVPISAYLIAIAVGDLKSRRIGRISEVWGEEGYLDAASHDFGDIDQMLEAAESVVGPYRFGVYNILVLPPSFPHGGMENPCLTFVTPTLLTGDKSLATVVAHELAHSWFGNLVTAKTNEHFWLNEGFTVFLERKIAGALFGEDQRRFSARIGYISLKDVIKKAKRYKDTALVLNLTGMNPQDVVSRVAYEKGHTFLWYLEQVVGGAESMNAFLKSYVDQFAFKAADSEDMKSSFLTFFSDKKNLTSIDWDVWLHGPGLPSYVPDYNTTLETQVDQLLDKWRNINCDNLEFVSSADTENFTTLQKIAFLTKVNTAKLRLTASDLKKMSTEYGFDASTNSEILSAWLTAALRNHYEPAVEPAKEFLRRIGRLKFSYKLFLEFFMWPDRREEAEALFNEIKPRLMDVARRQISKAHLLATA